MAAVDPHLFRSFVNRVATVWTGYQVAVDLSSGGPETKKKHEWFVDVLAECIITSRNLSADDLEEWINSLLYTDFDLILEDESVYPTAQLLLEAFSYMKANDLEGLARIEAGLPSVQVIQNVKQESRQEAGDDDCDVDMEDDDDDSGADGDECQREQRERQPKTVTDDDGWTTILKK